MSNLIGNIEHFDPKISDIITYMERLEQLFVCNIVEERMKVSMLLTLIGSEAYSTLKDILTPELPSAKTYEELKTKLIDHYSPKRLQIAERYKFWSAVQEPGEDIQSFVIKLKSLSLHCSFGAFLHEAWRDKFVCGIRSQMIKRKLLSMSKLTFESAYNEALSMELAEGQVRSMSKEPINAVPGNIDKVYKKANSRNLDKTSRSHYKSTCKESGSEKSNQKSWKLCHRCGVRKHDSEKCPAKDWECFKCKLKGHTSRVCRKGRMNTLEEQEEVESSSSEGDLVLGFLSSIHDTRREKPAQVNLELEGRLIKFEIDSGACRTVMHSKDYHTFLSDLNLFDVTYDLRVLTGDGVKILGETDVFVKNKDKIVNLPLVVLDSNHKFTPLLGRNWLNVLNLEWRQKLSFNCLIESNNVCKSKSYLDSQVCLPNNDCKSISESSLSSNARLSL